MPPTADEVRRIAALDDPVLRNLLITQAYHELAAAWTPADGATWCSFATWASKQAGQTIRGEDLEQAIARHVGEGPEVEAVLGLVRQELARFGRGRDVQALRAALHAAVDPAAAARRASAAVARGNLKVFAEIADVFARALALPDEPAARAAGLDALRATLRPGPPPQGQDLLRDALTAYEDARAATGAARAERLFHANLLVGLHEQTRLQPEIAAALDAAVDDPERARGRLLAALLPGPWLRLRVHLARLLGRPLPLDRALDRLVDAARRAARRAVTETLLVLPLPGGRTLHLGRDLPGPFPDVLARITHPPLQRLLARIDPTPDHPAASGAVDWADLDDRMHFITDFFRSHHAWPPLAEPPFTPAQVALLKAGRRPPSPL